jgi:hypothetical protein
LIALGVPGLIGAWIAAAPAAAKERPTRLPGVTTTVDVPPDFDPITASDNDLAANGFPPRPDERLAPTAFARWKRAVGPRGERIVPELRPSAIRHLPHLPRGTRDGAVLSANWSGYALTANVTAYSSSSFVVALAEFTVPVAQQAFGRCDGTWDYSASWVGIDGYESNDVLQAGTESDAYCAAGGAVSYYSAWYEWYPAWSVAITNFAVAPGHDLFVEVWATSPTVGHAFLFDFNTAQSVSLTFNAPAGTSLIGNSAEWVVERPSIGNQLATLSNYAQDYFANCVAFQGYGQISGPAALPQGVASTQLLMTGQTSSDIISTPSLVGPAAIVFSATGSAY